ncbi:MAG: lipoyl synthase [Deltaproteobacteria bacterium]|nr:lipoyl synthase [Deltaproteobacteria bacterium]
MKRPDWLTVQAPDAEALDQMKRLLDAGRLHTVCEDADCPNIGECFAGKTCTFMILGNVCTRNCRFCAVVHGRPSVVDSDEPQAVASAARHLGLKHVVVTSVTRDDLADGGAGHFAATIGAVHDEMPEATIEVLIPDFLGNIDSLHRVIDAEPDVINHNVETVPRSYPSVRPQALYSRSLALLQEVREFGSGILSKSGLMLGLGETEREVIEVMEDLRAVHCDILTLGQYLSPSPVHHPVVEYIHPDTFKSLEKIGYDMGFMEVHAGPLVRSSYHADRIFSRIGATKTRKGGQTNHGENR